MNAVTNKSEPIGYQEQGTQAKSQTKPTRQHYNFLNISNSQSTVDEGQSLMETNSGLSKLFNPVRKIAKIMLLLFVFLYVLPALLGHFMWQNTMGQQGVFSYKQGPDTEFSQGCLSHHLPSLKEYSSGIYCAEYRWLDYSVIMQFTVKDSNALESVLNDFKEEHSYKKQRPTENSGAHSWWNTRADASNFKKYVKEREHERATIWVAQNTDGIGIWYEYSSQ